MEDIIDIIVTETTNIIKITAQPNDEVIDVNIIDNREDVVLNVTPTVVEININSLVGNFGVNWGQITGTLSSQTDLQNALNLKADLVDGKVPSSQLPSYVDDVVEVANFASLPVTGEVGKIYITLDTNNIYRWSGSTYVEIADSSAVWGAITGTLSNQFDLQSAFNAKQAALSGTGFVKISGTTISYDNSTYLTTSAAASTYLALGGGSMTGALIGTSAGFTGYVGIGNTSPLYQLDVTGSGRFEGDLHILSTNPRIYLTDSDNNPDYFISNTDGTFTIYDVTNSTSRFTIGTTGNATFTNAITGGGSITGTALYSTGIVSVGTSLSVGTFVSAGGSLTGSALYVTGMTSGSGAIYHTGSRLTFANYNASGTLHFEVNGGTGALTINADTSATFASTLSATGATLTGALSGTSATFSSSVTAVGTTIKNPSVDGSIPLISIRDTSDVYQIGYLNFNQSTDLMTLMNKQGYSASGIAFGTNNIERVRITVGGNVGIGTTAPSQPLEIGGTGNILVAGGGTIFSGAGALYVRAGSGGDLILGANNTNGLMRITSAGNMGIGNGSSYAPYLITLNVTGGGQTIGGIDNSNGASLGLIQFNAGSMLLNARGNGDTNHMQFNTGGSERMRITSGGAVGIGTSNTGTDLVRIASVTNTANCLGLVSTDDIANAGFVMFRNSATSLIGQISRVGTTNAIAYITTSDYRLKEDLKPINGLEIVNKIKVYDFKWKNHNDRMDGVLAHELQEILPYAVNGLKDGEQMQGVDYSKIVPVLIQAIKEQQVQIEQLKNK